MTSTVGWSSVMESESAADRRNSSLRLPQYLMRAIFGADAARIDISEFHCRHTSLVRNLHYFLSIADGEHDTRATRAATCADNLSRTTCGFNSCDKLLCLRWDHAERDLRFMMVAHDGTERFTPHKSLGAIADSVQMLPDVRFPASHPCNEFVCRFSRNPRVDKYGIPEKFRGQFDGLYLTFSIQYRGSLPNNGKVKTTVPGTESIFDVKGRLARITQEHARRGGNKGS